MAAYRGLDSGYDLPMAKPLEEQFLYVRREPILSLAEFIVSLMVCLRMLCHRSY